jgi:phosphoribosylaminoimidazolecarboxamide formyltransferase/IMP cyclohydrolase
VSDLKKMYHEVRGDSFPPDLTITVGGQRLRWRKRSWRIKTDEGEQELGLRYGENPDQEAALYELVEGNLEIAGAELLGPGRGLVSAMTSEDLIQSGKHPSKINLTDLDSALGILKHLSAAPAAVIIKHNNPCGVARGADLEAAYLRAYMSDRIAAFGGCLVVNRPIGRAAAEAIAGHYLEVVAAPDFEDGTVEMLARRKNLRIIRLPGIGRLEEQAAKRVLQITSLSDGGIILQHSQLNAVTDASRLKPAEATYKGQAYRIERAPTEREAADMVFGWAVEMGVTSNSVIYVKDGAAVAIGTGEQDRVGVAEIAIFKAYTKYADRLAIECCDMPYKTLERAVAEGRKPASVKQEIDDRVKAERAGLPGSVMVSDGFLPFRDSVDVAIQEGVTAIIQPGGSLRDFESIEACNEASPKISMVFTGQRLFKH